MRNRLKSGGFQLFIVSLFVIASFSLSKFLENDSIGKQEYASKERLIFVQTETFEPQDYRRSFETTGVVEALHEVKIIPEVTGRVVWVNEKIYKGESFEKNEPLFEIDRSDYDIEVIKTETELARANTALDLELAEAKASFEEWRDINGEIQASDLVLRKPQLAEAHARLKAALAQKEKAVLNLSRTIYKLPFKGKMINSDISEGQFLMAGQVCGRVYNSSLLEVHSSLSDHQLQILSNDNTFIEIEVNSKKYTGRVKRFATSVDKSTRFAGVRFSFDHIDDNILVGSFARVNIQGEILSNVILIPFTALQKDGTIVIVDENDIITKFKPQIIQVRDDEIAITGIDTKCRIVVDSMPSAINGMKVVTKYS